MKLLLLVALGGFLGAIGRFIITNFVQARHNMTFPWGTFTVNTAGSFFLGILFGLSTLQPEVILLVGTGFLGSFTTFSTFEMESVELVRKKKTIISLVYLLSSTILGVLAAYIGYLLGQTL